MNLASLIATSTGFRKQSTQTWEGPCPRCGDDKRLIVWIHKDIFRCQICDFKGDAVTFLRETTGIGCGEAHLELGKECAAPDCGGHGKCAATRSGCNRQVKSDKQRKLETPVEKTGTSQAWQPTEAVPPQELWQQRALKLVEEAHTTLLKTPEQLDFLAARGIPLGAVEKNRLGWLEKDYYRAREVWGLPAEIGDNGKKRQFWLPPGIVIPFFQGETIQRIRIRVPDWKLEEIRQAYAKQKLDKKPPSYYWVLGSGDDTWVINPSARAFVIIESDLDGIMVDWHAGDLVGTIPLGTCSVRPKEAAAKLLRSAVCILNALDFEPRINKTSGKNENPGGENWLRWWKPHFRQAKRHPVPSGKDPGEAFQAGVDIRSWIISGLPAGLRPATAPASAAAGRPQLSPDLLDAVYRGISPKGETYIVAPDEASGERLTLFNPGAVIFTRAEIASLKKQSPELAAQINAINWKKEKS